MLWNKARRSDNVNDTRQGKDARKLTGITLAGGLALTALAGAGMYATHGTPSNDLSLATSNIRNQPAISLAQPGEDLQLAFVQSILGETEDTWKQLFAQLGRHYPEPPLTLFNNGVASGCGYVNSASGPFYCPDNHQVYLDLEFFAQMRERYSVVGDFAQAYIVAHEIAHHVQLLLKLSEPFEQALENRQTVIGDGGLEVRAELQADCLAGVWAHHAQKRLDWLEPGDIDAVLQTASAFGDDAIQRSHNSVIRPEKFSHGTSMQRGRWFKSGFANGQPDKCDTFAAEEL